MMIDDRRHAAETADPKSLEEAIQILRERGSAIEPNLFLSDMRRSRLFRAADYLQAQFDDVCRFLLMEDAL